MAEGHDEAGASWFAPPTALFGEAEAESAGAAEPGAALPEAAAEGSGGGQRRGSVLTWEKGAEEQNPEEQGFFSDILGAALGDEGSQAGETGTVELSHLNLNHLRNNKL